MKQIIALAAVLAFMGLNAQAEDFFLVNGKVVKNGTLINRTNNLVRILHDEGDNTYQINYFTKDSQKMLKKIPVDDAKRKEIEDAKEAARKKRLERLQLKSEFKPLFAVVPSEVKYVGGNAASMTVSNALNETVRVDIISSRIVRKTIILKPKQIKKRILFRHQKGNRVSIKAGDKTKIFDVN